MCQRWGAISGNYHPDDNGDGDDIFDEEAFFVHSTVPKNYLTIKNCFCLEAMIDIMKIITYL